MTKIWIKRARHKIKQIFANKIIKKKYLNSLCPYCDERTVTHYPMAPDDEDGSCKVCRELSKVIRMRICSECKSKSNIAGQAMTGYRCEECNIKEIHGNTAVPRICINCSNKLNQCQRCRGDLVLDAI